MLTLLPEISPLFAITLGKGHIAWLDHVDMAINKGRGLHRHQPRTIHRIPGESDAALHPGYRRIRPGGATTASNGLSAAIAEAKHALEQHTTIKKLESKEHQKTILNQKINSPHEMTILSSRDIASLGMVDLGASALHPYREVAPVAVRKAGAPFSQDILLATNGLGVELVWTQQNSNSSLLHRRDNHRHNLHRQHQQRTENSE